MNKFQNKTNKSNSQLLSVIEDLLSWVATNLDSLLFLLYLTLCNNKKYMSLPPVPESLTVTPNTELPKLLSCPEWSECLMQSSYNFPHWNTIQWIFLFHGYQPEVILLTRGHLAMPGNIFGCFWVSFKSHMSLLKGCKIWWHYT